MSQILFEAMSPSDVLLNGVGIYPGGVELFPEASTDCIYIRIGKILMRLFFFAQIVPIAGVAMAAYNLVAAGYQVFLYTQPSQEDVMIFRSETIVKIGYCFLAAVYSYFLYLYSPYVATILACMPKQVQEMQRDLWAEVQTVQFQRFIQDNILRFVYKEEIATSSSG